ncbi:MAG: MoxR family ATPase [Desulfurococcales archaeon]|nr:MoxR family ATPase [Desulfurococcales archaeon]
MLQKGAYESMVEERVYETYADIIKSDLPGPIRDPKAAVKLLEKKYKLVVDEKIVALVFASFMNGRPVLFEGPPGTGKTEVGEALLELWAGKKPFVLPCSESYDEYKVIGDFHPLLAMQKGFNEESFIPRPLLSALILDTGILIDEIRRSSEEFQNILLDVSDKRRIIVPELKRVFRARGEGFQIIFTSNPEDIGQNELSDAFLRRVVRVEFNYPPRHVEARIMELRASPTGPKIPSHIAQLMLDAISQLRTSSVVYRPGPAETVLWARMAQAIAELRGSDIVTLEDVVKAAESVLVKRPEDHEIVVETIKKVLGP